MATARPLLAPEPLPVVVGLSGGVDSAVAAWLLTRAGHRVSGLFMKNWEEDDRPGHCAAARDLADAQAVCDVLGIPLARISFAAEYWERVFMRFLAEHRAGRTPNPDVLCNQEIKFSAFLDHALRLGAERIATGHYARIAPAGGQARLLKGRDPAKDQSYFLHRLDQAQLARTLFPLGEMSKVQVRQLAARQALPTHAKKDSTGICFIGERPFAQFLARYLPSAPGEIQDLDGRPLGRHPGLMYYTIGQRQGLGLGGRRGSGGAPWYVASKNLADNVLVVVQGHDHPALYCGALAAGDLHWVAGHPPALRFECAARVRYRQAEQPCRVSVLDHHRVLVEFARPQRAVTPGQSVVLYRGDECLGGAVIEEALPG